MIPAFFLVTGPIDAAINCEIWSDEVLHAAAIDVIVERSRHLLVHDGG